MRLPLFVSRAWLISVYFQGPGDQLAHTQLIWLTKPHLVALHCPHFIILRSRHVLHVAVAVG